jgi:hypothetical protein
VTREEEACINILFASLRDSLSAEEDQVLTLRLMDIPWQRVGEILGQGASEIAKMRKRIATTAWMVWSLPIAEQEHSQDEKRAYTQTPPIPHELPANLVAVLTDQERQALTAYQQGASQEVAAQQSGLSQPTVSRLLAFVWESCQQPPEAMLPELLVSRGMIDGRNWWPCFITGRPVNWSPTRSYWLSSLMRRTLNMPCGWRSADITGSLREPKSV